LTKSYRSPFTNTPQPRSPEARGAWRRIETHRDASRRIETHTSKPRSFSSCLNQLTTLMIDPRLIQHTPGSLSLLHSIHKPLISLVLHRTSFFSSPRGVFRSLTYRPLTHPTPRPSHARSRAPALLLLLLRALHEPAEPALHARPPHLGLERYLAGVTRPRVRGLGAKV